MNFDMPFDDNKNGEVDAGEYALYFAADPDDENDGAFGSIRVVRK